MKVLDENGLNTLVGKLKAKMLETTPVSRGGTGATTAKAANNVLMGYPAVSSSGPIDDTKIFVQKASPSEADGAFETMTAKQLKDFITADMPPTDTQTYTLQPSSPTIATRQTLYTGRVKYKRVQGVLVCDLEVVLLGTGTSTNTYKWYSQYTGEDLTIGTLPIGFRPVKSYSGSVTDKMGSDDSTDLKSTFTIDTNGLVSMSIRGTSSDLVSVTSMWGESKVDASITDQRMDCKWWEK